MTAALTPYDLDADPRREHFRLYTSTCPCSFAVTADIDVTGALLRHRETGAPFYGLMIYAILKTANAMTCFRLDWLDKAGGKPGLWSEVGANFTHMHADTHTFSSLWLPWEPDEAAFLENYRDVLARAKGRHSLLALGDIPRNAVPISMIPWLGYSSFQVNLPDPLYLRPVVTMGKYEEKNGRMMMPMTLQMHHAAGDGWHASEAFRAVESFTKTHCGVDR